MLKYIPVEEKNVNTQLLNIPTGEREPFTSSTPVQKRHRHPYLRFICGIKSNSQTLIFIFFYFWDELSHKVKIVQPNFSLTFTFLFKIIFRLICVETPWLNTNRVQGEILSKMLQSKWTQFSLQCWQFCQHFVIIGIMMARSKKTYNHHHHGVWWPNLYVVNCSENWILNWVPFYSIKCKIHTVTKLVNQRLPIDQC